MLRIIKNAEKEAQLSKHKVLQPVHLLIGCLDEDTGALGEIRLKCKIDKCSLRSMLNDIDNTSNQQKISSVYFNVGVTREVVNVMEVAINYMKRYKQIYLNEGHLLKALIMTNVTDKYLSDENRNIILNLGTTSRDMITLLGNYTLPKMNSHFIRKVKKNDFQHLTYFVENNFSSDWSQTIKEAFSTSEPSIYIALDKNREIVGFAAFDIYKNKKGHFGPMGVASSNRVTGIGYSLLHHCLKDMSDIGYEYAIIGGAGPIEFYEKACNAVVIPS
ncbi:GNAT family N-acetyltransferase [Psychrobacillus sp. FJAT-51614]